MTVQATAGGLPLVAMSAGRRTLFEGPSVLDIAIISLFIILVTATNRSQGRTGTGNAIKILGGKVWG